MRAGVRQAAVGEAAHAEKLAVCCQRSLQALPARRAPAGLGRRRCLLPCCSCPCTLRMYQQPAACMAQTSDSGARLYRGPLVLVS